jgi:hypothetical protein
MTDIAVPFAHVCDKHPNYRGIRLPKSSGPTKIVCPVCLAFYYQQHPEKVLCVCGDARDRHGAAGICERAHCFCQGFRPRP